MAGAARCGLEVLEARTLWHVQHFVNLEVADIVVVLVAGVI